MGHRRLERPTRVANRRAREVGRGGTKAGQQTAVHHGVMEFPT